MYCKHCGTKIPEGALFCTTCGNKLTMERTAVSLEQTEENPSTSSNAEPEKNIDINGGDTNQNTETSSEEPKAAEEELSEPTEPTNQAPYTSYQSPSHPGLVAACWIGWIAFVIALVCTLNNYSVAEWYKSKYKSLTIEHNDLTGKYNEVQGKYNEVLNAGPWATSQGAQEAPLDIPILLMDGNILLQFTQPMVGETIM